MHRIRVMAAIAAAVVGVALAVPPVRADTCCANTPVQLQPEVADPGQAVRATGLRCLASDNSATVDQKPVRFWLWPGARAGEDEPDTTPGEGLPADLPDTEAWPAFGSVEVLGSTFRATLTVPRLASRSYQLWWWCEGGGPGGGIHYSTGPRLAVGLPDTAAAPSDRSSPPGDWRASLIMIAGILGLCAGVAATARGERGAARTRTTRMVQRGGARPSA